jgi:uncharacterized protein (TIGR03437 family)
MKRGTVLGLVFCVGVGALARGQGGSVATPANWQSQLPQSSPTARTQLVGNYGKLPLSFEANLGQAGKSVQFLSRGDGYGLYLTDDGAVLELRKGRCPVPGLRRAEAACEAGADVVRMRLAGASGETAVPAGEERLPGTANYFIGSDPALWRTSVPTYAKVRYRGVYKGVDLVYYGSQRQLEYDFLVAPGADPKPIRLRFTGAKSVRLGADGNLIVAAANGELNFHKPDVYQVVDGRRKVVEGSFALLTKRTAGFQLGSYDRSKPLVIDPALEYATYLGGSGGDQASAIAVDANGNAYVAGYTLSSDFPVTQGAFETATPAGFRGYAAFVTKLNPSGTALVYSTYLVASGGSAVANAVAVDGSGSAYVVGRANTGFPVTPGAFQTTISAGAFVAKLNPAGNALVYSTCLSGTGWSYEGMDSAAAVAVDGAGDAYVAGASFSSDFPVTAGAFQTKNKAGFAPNAFVSKLNPAGSALVYSTYLGGTGRVVFSIGPQQFAGDGATGLAVDGAGNAYVAGYAYSNDFPVTAGAYQTVNRATVPYIGGVLATIVRSNAFVARLNPAGTALVYSTYLGGSTGSDSAAGVAVDGSGNAYIAGAAKSTDFPVTSGAFQATNHAANSSNAFVTKLNPAGSALVYSTYLGGSDLNSAVMNGESTGDSAAGIAVDSTGHAYITGMAGAPDFPVTRGAFQTVSRPGDGRNAYLTELNGAGTALVYSTYLGGTGGDWGNAVAIDGSGKAYIAGSALSTDFPVTQGAFQTVNHATGGNGNAFVAKFDLNAILSAPSIAPGGIVPVDSNVGTIQPGEWASIYGTNLADSAETWANGPFPNYLGDTSVTVDGKPAYLTYVSPGQINLQVPDDPAVGTVSVVVTTGGGSATAKVTLAEFAPAFLLFDTRHVAGVILRQDGSGTFGQGEGSYDLLGPTGNSLGFPTVAAKPGDILELFGTGFGPTIPAVAPGQAFSGAAPTANAVSVLINSVSVTPMWAGLSGAGLDQINLTIPAGLGTGDVPLVATVGGVQTPTYAVISLQ